MRRRIAGLTGTVAAVAAVLSLLAGCSGAPDRSDSRPQRLPLGLLLKYSYEVLWPCIAQHGVDPGRTPSCADVVSGDQMLIDPYARLHSQISGELLAQLRRDCPAVPPPLTSAAG